MNVYTIFKANPMMIVMIESKIRNKMKVQIPAVLCFSKRIIFFLFRHFFYDSNQEKSHFFCSVTHIRGILFHSQFP